MNTIDYLETGTKQLLAQIEDNILTLTLNRPKTKNALSESLTPYLRKILKLVKKDKSIRILIITGYGDAFCSGGDIKSMSKKSIINNKTKITSTKNKVKELQKKQLELTGVLYSLNIPTIAILKGVAAGAGLSLALACDIRIATTNSFIISGYSKIGLSGDYGITWLLSKITSPSIAKEIMFTNKRINAKEAKSLGIFNQVYSKNLLTKKSKELCSQIVSGAPNSVCLIKKNINNSFALTFKEALKNEAINIIKSASTDDHKEAVNAFIEKRKAVFKGK